MLSGVAEWTINIIEKGGYFGLGFLVALENLIPPIPSEIILPLAGFLTGQKRLVFIFAVLAATIGSVLGAILLYYIGDRVGETRLRRFIEKRGKWLLISTDDFEKSSRWFSKHGPTAVLVGRCIPGIRSFISIPAGIQHMPLWRFTAYTAIGSAIWNTVLIALGWWLGARWERVGDLIGKFEIAIWIVIAIVIIGWVAHKIRQCRRHPC